MIILCDDGSLKIYVADSDKTDYWLHPPPINTTTTTKPAAIKRANAIRSKLVKTSDSTKAVSFLIDYSSLQ